MKKFVSIIVALVLSMMVPVMALGNAETGILTGIYGWWKDTHWEEYRLFLETDYNPEEGFSHNHTAYAAGELYLSNDFSGSLHTVEEKVAKYMNDEFNCQTEVEITVIGRKENKDILRFEINVDKDMRDFGEGFNIFEEEINRLVVICYDNY